MTPQEKHIGEILGRIADELNISRTMQDKAVNSYNAVGNWLGAGLDYDIRIMPQGSMNLGTVVRPIDDSDDYDMDLVCLVSNGQQMSCSDIKSIVGNRLKEHKLYRDLLEKEGKRCWTMQYEEFHMDILPCIPNAPQFIVPDITEIKLTHKVKNNQYEFRYSNPYAYHRWFEERMKDSLIVQKHEFAVKNQVEIDEVPTYRMRTPLQKTIQILKRHRDVCFQEDPDDAPISIIITTLAGLAYNGEENVYEALSNILKKMPEFIECRNGVYWIENPVMNKENFADKWNDNPNKRNAFFSWISRARKELITEPLTYIGIDRIANQYKQVLGKAPVERAIKAVGNDLFEARTNKKLYVNGLTGGLSLNREEGSILVKGHTFFGE